MNFTQLVAIIRAAWVSIAAMVVVASLVAFAFSSALPKEYTAKARVMLNVGNMDQTQFSDLQPHSEDSYIATQIRLVGDPMVMRDVVGQLGWTSDPSVIAAWQQATGGTGDVASWASRRLVGNVAARQFGDSAIIEIYYSAESVETAKTIVGMIRTAFIANDLKLRVDSARKASAWNRTVAALAFEKLRAAEAERDAFMRANQIAVDSSNGSLEMQELTAKLTASVPAMPTTLDPVATPSMISLRNQLTELDTQIALLGQERGPSDPATFNLAVVRDQIRGQLARETAFAQAGANATDAQIVANRALRDREYLAARLRVLDRAPLYDRLADIDREVTLRTTLYTQAENRVKSFESVAAAPSGLNVIGDIIADDDMVYPNTPLTVGLAAGITLGLGIAIALISEMMRRMVRGAEDLEFYSGVPVMAVIAAAPPRRKLFGRLGRLRAFRPGRRTVPGPA